MDLILFSGSEEKEKGADWYWHISVGDRAIHSLVQAKRIQRTEFGQDDKNGIVRIDWEQLQKLVSAAKRQPDDELPHLEAWLVTFGRHMNALPPCPRPKLHINDCHIHNHVPPCQALTPSVWVAQAGKVSGVLKTSSSKTSRVKFEEILKESLRLDCLLPCIRPASELEADKKESQEKPQPSNGASLPMSGPSTKGFFLEKGIPAFDQCLERVLEKKELKSKLQGALHIHLPR
ncbi:MAG: hypothetical protein DWQ01_11640 [Planctomycetota bacterium]|nr:MAG: hypothetical protein DWQ01_11640 [Planctomycetota bacterium]